MPTARADIALTSSGDLPAVGALVRNAELAAQRIGVRLRTWLGEWLLDSRKGLALREWAQTKPYPVDLVATYVRREVETTPGVVRCTLTASTFDATTRAHRLDFAVVVEDGTTLAVSVSPELLARSNRAAGFLIRLA